MTDICPEAIALLSLQSIAGVLIEALSVGVFIVKLSSKPDAQRIQNTTFVCIHTNIALLPAYGWALNENDVIYMMVESD